MCIVLSRRMQVRREGAYGAQVKREVEPSKGFCFSGNFGRQKAREKKGDEEIDAAGRRDSLWGLWAFC